MDTHEEQHQPQAQATESTSSQTATERGEEEKQDGKRDSRKEEWKAGRSAETVDSTRTQGVSLATMTAVKQLPVRKGDSKEKTEDKEALGKADSEKVTYVQDQPLSPSARDCQPHSNSFKTPRRSPEEEQQSKSEGYYILDRKLRHQGISKISKIFLQSLDAQCRVLEPSTDSRIQGIVNCVPPEDLLKQLWETVVNGKYTVLHGPAGCGKTTTALLLKNFLCNLTFADIYLCDPSTLEWWVENSRPYMSTLYIIDNFFGHTSLDNYEQWSHVSHILRRIWRNPKVHFLLVTRTSILEQAVATTGADFADILNTNTFVELSVNYHTLFQKVLPKTKIEPDFNAIPDIGFPVCCRLASSMPEERHTEIFQRPQCTLRSLIKGKIHDRVALLSLALLAVTEGYVSLRLFRNPARKDFFPYLLILLAVGAGEVDEETLTLILDFYNENQSLVQVDDDFVSFTNEAVREAVLCVLCESHAQFLAKHCSLRLLSRLALITRDPDQTEDDEKKPVMPTSARMLFLNRLLDEMRFGNYRDTLPSALFEHLSFPEDFQTETVRESLLEVWSSSTTKQQEDFAFWVCASKTVAKILLPEIEECSTEVIQQGLVGSCYWGDADVLKKLLSETTPQQKSVILASKMTALTQRFDGHWQMLPFHPEDTLLTLAAWRGQDDVVKELVAMGADVNAQGHCQLTALMHYCARGNLDMVMFLLQNRAVVHLQDDIENTALHYALLGGLQTLPDDLFDDKALRLQNRECKTPWIIACSSGAPRVILERLRRRTQDTALYHCLVAACMAGQRDVVEYLFEIESEAGPLLRHEEGLDAVSPLLAALMHGKPDRIVDILIPKLTCRQDCVEIGLLCSAFCGYHDYRIFKELLPIVNNHIKLETALTTACIMGSKSVLEELLKIAPTYINKKDILKKAAAIGSWELMEWAMKTYKLRMTTDVIRYAMEKQQVELVKTILTCCPSTSGKHIGYLHLAIKCNLVPVMKWLIDNYLSDVKKERLLFYSFLRTAMRFGNEDAVKCLLVYGAKFRPSADVLAAYVDGRYTRIRLYNALKKITPFLEQTNRT